MKRGVKSAGWAPVIELTVDNLSMVLHIHQARQIVDDLSKALKKAPKALQIGP